MASLRILGSGSTPQAQANSRGRLFEQLMADVLRTYGYSISRIPSVNYAGMELDIEGHESLSGTPLYAECKCYETEVDCPKLQAFYGKYMAKWLKDNMCRGLFIALPGLNSHAMAFYRENCEAHKAITVRLLEEDAVLKAIYTAKIAVEGETIARGVPPAIGRAGDQVLLYTEHGPIWLQYLVSPGTLLVDKFLLFDAQGQPITSASTLEYVNVLHPELASFEFATISTEYKPRQLKEGSTSEPEQIVEVRGSSAWFEYQFPASPEYFIGRKGVLQDVDDLARDICTGQTSARGLLFTGYSGWGKSSAVLASAEQLRRIGHFAVVIDCRSISNSKSVLRAVEHTVQKIRADQGELFRTSCDPITGFDGAIQALSETSAELRKLGRLAFVFLDQFENLFFIPDTLKRIRDLLFKFCDSQSQFVLGFAWKTDLIGATNDFPFQVRDAIADVSKKIPLDTFSDVETNALLDKLKSELRTELRRDLRFFLSEFSQGLPWLLKKLCAHVKSQRASGVPQSEIANRVLNIEQLFREDLAGLSAEQEDVLRRIAKSAPVPFSDLSEHYSAAVVQSLVDARLVVRIANKYDIYWDIFRDYLNTGWVPVQENYLPRMQVGSVLKSVSTLARAGGRVSLSSFRSLTKLSEHSAMNVVRDLRLLGLASVDEGALLCSIPVNEKIKDNELVQVVRTHLREHLVRNRLVSRLVNDLSAEQTLSLADIGSRLAKWCPYVTATAETWKMYARILSSWMDLADLATFKSSAGTLGFYQPLTELRERDIYFRRINRSGILMPSVQYSPVEQVALEIARRFEGKGKLDWSRFRKSTVQKAFATLEDLGFLSRIDNGYRLSTDFTSLVTDQHKRSEVFGTAVMNLPAFRTFLQVLNRHAGSGAAQAQIGKELRDALGVQWKDGTAKTNAKILMDWARHTGLAPGVFSSGSRGRRRAAHP